MLADLRRALSLRGNHTARFGYLLFGLVFVLYLIQFRLIQQGSYQVQSIRTQECLEKLNKEAPRLPAQQTSKSHEPFVPPSEREPSDVLQQSLLPGWALPDLPANFTWSISTVADSHMLDEPWDISAFSEGMKDYDDGVAQDKPSVANPARHQRKSEDAKSKVVRERENAAIEQRDSRLIQGETPLIFIHIPKTAGTTVSEYLEDNWERHKGCRGILHRHRNLAGSVVESMRDESAGKCLFTIVWHRSVPVTRLRHWVLKEGIDFLYEHGHHPIGLCMYFARGCHYTTVLREPIERSVSHYYYLRTLPENFAPFVLQLNKELDTMDKFLDAVETNKFFHYGLFNMHTLMLSGDNAWNFAADYNLCNMHLHGCDVHPEALSWAHVQFAKRNLLTQFPIIGLTDRLLEYGVLMKLRYGYPYTGYLCGKENANTQQHRNDTLTESQLVRIRKINKYDIALYDFAVRLHEAQIRDAGDRFVEEMKVAEKYCQDVREKKIHLGGDSKSNPKKKNGKAKGKKSKPVIQQRKK